MGLVAGIELQPRDGAPGARGFDTFLACFERGVLIRVTGDTIALSPPLVVETGHIDEIVGTLAETLRSIA
jgi:beta-alanine--pyruvate transaminase